MTSEEPPQDTTRDWAAEEAEAIRLEEERQAELLRKQQKRE
jgi:hypothetical protein